MFPEIKGKIREYDIIVAGHQRCNPYFNEDPDNPPPGAMAVCTSTLIRGTDRDGNPYALLIDPALSETPERFYFALNRRTGLQPEAITHCYCTHAHFDHIQSFNYFPKAKWLCPKGMLPMLRASYLVNVKKFEEVEGEFLPGVYAVPLPGHTDTLHGVAFEFDRLRIIVSGDAVATKNHFIHETTGFEDNTENAIATIRMIKAEYDVIIPGHDNLILNVGERRKL